MTLDSGPIELYLDPELENPPEARTMTDTHSHERTPQDLPCRTNQQLRRGSAAVGWSFVYVFFSNGTPFDAPNRSETCPRS